MSELIMESVPLPIIRKESQLVMRGGLVRCRDCKHYIDGECMAEDGNGDYLRLAVPPTHFCAWGERRFITCKCGESIELRNREYAVCPSCGRMVRE